MSTGGGCVFRPSGSAVSRIGLARNAGRLRRFDGVLLLVLQGGPIAESRGWDHAVVRYFRHAGLRLAFDVVGAGVPLVLHCGAAGDSRMWREAGYMPQFSVRLNRPQP